MELVCALCAAKPCFPAMTSMLGRLPVVLDMWDASCLWDHHLVAISERLCVAGHQEALVKISFIRLVQKLGHSGGSDVVALRSPVSAGVVLCAPGQQR